MELRGVYKYCGERAVPENVIYGKGMALNSI
jgi:hypothetical protein